MHKIKDPFDVIQRTLSNGIKVYMSINKVQPQIYTNIIFRAGSKHDPADTTGLAHYMEHMLFKGTPRIGAMNWEKESVILKQIEELYEKHRKTTDPEEKKKIYSEIDQLSFEAAQYVAPNEYDRLITYMGGESTNAYTGVEQTVYINKIPSNEFEKWVMLEKERFTTLALRLFHTELETVFEEFNMIQDSDGRKVFQALRKLLFPQHPYGTQEIIGTAYHLKNPSIREINNFFEKYYVSNNMAIILSGDFNPDETMEILERHFGQLPNKMAPEFQYEKDEWPSTIQRMQIKGEEAPFIFLGWRIEGSDSDSPYLIPLINALLHNESTGLMDVHINQEQKLLDAGTLYWPNQDYGIFALVGRIRNGQSIEEGEKILIEQIERLQNGDFQDWLIEAVINDMEVKMIRGNNKNSVRVNQIANAYKLGLPWEKMYNFPERLRQFTKKDVMAYAKKFLSNNYAFVEKIKAPDPEVIKVEKPPMTPVQLNPDNTSEYAKKLMEIPIKRIVPTFVEFEKHLHHPTPFSIFMENKDDKLFRLELIIPFGSHHTRMAAVALEALYYTGTSKYSYQHYHEQFFRLGVSAESHFESDRLLLSISGLEKNIKAGLDLFLEIIQDPKIKPNVLANMMEDALQKRAVAMQNRQYVLKNALVAYGKYGLHSPFNYKYNEEELRKIKPSDIQKFIKGLLDYPYEVHFYGKTPPDQVLQYLGERKNKKVRLQEKEFTQWETQESKVFIYDFPLVQSDILMISKGTPHFDKNEFLHTEWFNEYFGTGLSSVVFREIRESRALAYSTYAYFSTPPDLNKAHYLMCYLGTQPDKIETAINAMSDILKTMPVDEKYMRQTAQALLTKIETSRIEPRDYIFHYDKLQKMGFEHDARKDRYEFLSKAQPNDLIAFHNQKIKNRTFNYMFMGQKKDLDMKFLEQLGPIHFLSEKDLFAF
ncbi:MAG: M16 family metallopeptidase [Saprospiraceae bacterium]|jgi:predicted Zn-dependent peptidase